MKYKSKARKETTGSNAWKGMMYVSKYLNTQNRNTNVRSSCSLLLSLFLCLLLSLSLPLFPSLSSHSFVLISLFVRLFLSLHFCHFLPYYLLCPLQLQLIPPYLTLSFSLSIPPKLCLSISYLFQFVQKQYLL